MEVSKMLKSNSGVNLANSLTIKQVLSPKQKKLEGFDRTASTFVSKVEKLKTRPKVEVVEQQYIRGLQDEIKYMEMQLKLLQEKDMQKHSHIDQLEQFFGDGIPINQNILAIKNGFNTYKISQEKKVKELQNEKKERMSLIQSLSTKVDKLLKQLNEREKERQRELQIGQQQYLQMISKEGRLKKQVQLGEEELKTLKTENRGLFESIQSLSRNRLIENIVGIKYENSKMDKLNKLKEQLKQKQIQRQQVFRQLLYLQKQQQQKGTVIRLQQQNLNNRKKVIILQRECDNLRNRAKEKQMQLQQRLRQRMIEVNSKHDIAAKLETIKQQIKKQNSLTVEQIYAIARQKQSEILGNILNKNKKLAHYIDHYSNILSKLQQGIQTLAQRKPQAKSQLQAYGIDLKALKKKLDQQKDKNALFCAQSAQLGERYSLTKSNLQPLQQHIKRSKQQTQGLLQQRSRLVQQIKIKQKQLQLIYVLKCLNFQQAEISRTSNKNIQEQLVLFLKNWQKIQRVS